MPYTRVIGGMRVFGLSIPNSVSSVRYLELSKEARHRLKIMEWCAAHGGNASLTCRHFGISRDTLYRWLRRFERYGPGGLENGSHRPRHVRTPTWTKGLENAVLELRQLTPGWGKDKLVVLLRDQGWQYSTSMVGRIQVDTAHVSLFSEFSFKHFTACDVFTRWQVLEAHGRATAHAAAGFLDTILERMPFAVQAIQVDGGSDFRADFEDACRERGVKLFVLPPRSPKLNGHVERAQRTHKEEFYYRLTSATTLTQVNKLLSRWEDIHNTYRPHQALGQTTPLAFFRKCA